MDHLLSRVLMEVEGGLQQRRPMREISIIRDHLESGDESLEMLGLTQLCDVLNMASPMTLSAIRPPVFVPLVIKCMKRENLDLVILAARVLTYMVDAISSSVYVLSAEGGIDVLLQNLTEIKDIELSEQCLTCLEKVTENSSCASILLQNMGVSVLLTFIDFFSTASQRKAWLSVVAMCRCITVETFGCVEGSLQDISARIDHDDNKISENAITSLCHIISGVSSDSELVARAFSGICRPLMSVLNRGDMSDSVFTSVLALLSAAIVHSAQVAREVMESGIVEWMFELIRSSSEQQQRLSLGHHTSRSEDTREPSIGTEDITHRETVEMPAQRERRLSVEQSKMLCLALTSLLPRVNTGYPKYSDTLSALVSEALDNGDDRVLGSLADDNGVVNDEEDDDDDSEDGVEDDDEGEEEEEDGEETQYTHEEVLTRAAEVGILLEKNELYKSCKLTHSCDGCGIRCSPTNWFRCNKCHDYDLCGKCLLSEWESHAVDGAMHSFCDMSDVLHKTGEPLKASEGTDEHINHIMSQREELYHQCPQLLALVLNGIPTMVTLFNESETHLVRSHCLVFIDRALALATPKQISEIKGLSEAALCEMIVTAMVDTSLVLNVQVMYLCRLLLEKNPEVYLQCFIHEGVTNSLVKIHERNKCYRQQPEEEQESPVGSDATHLKCPTTIANWRELLSIEATNLLAMFSSLSDDSRICRLKNVDTLLRENRLQEAFDTLRAVLLDDTTAYELSTTDVLHTLVEKLKSVNDIGAVVALSRTLAKQGSNSASPFARFVRLLQTALSYLDQFQPPTFSVVKSIHTQIPLRLVVHTPGSGTKQKLSTGASKSGQNNRSAPSAPRSSSSPAPSRETTTRRPTTRATPRKAAPI
uniref:HECT-type E3 ubiquitin transferase n=1 Tax=Trypanosoma congolense (strain IL3000) TaxID=1068625 RepID=G0V2S4_TRYCI|nr:unnamed protein product [Trypanosoma congolense IL3000]